MLTLLASLVLAGCSKDTDCKGDRICERSVCVSPRSTSADAGSVNAPMSVRVRITSAGDRWAFYEAQTLVDIPGMPRRGTLSGLCGPSGPYWVDPAALDGLRPGQVLDEDPVTTVRLEVAEVGRLPSGREVVTVVSRGPGTTSGATYDKATGVALIIASKNTANGESYTLELERLP